MLNFLSICNCKLARRAAKQPHECLILNMSQHVEYLVSSSAERLPSDGWHRRMYVRVELSV